jgi:hypothetical protein
MINLFFPLLYHPDRGSSVLTQDEKAVFYNSGLRPAIVRLVNFDATEWPPSYTAEMFRAAKRGGGVSPQTKMVPAWKVPGLADNIRARLSENNVHWHEGAFVTHTIRGTKMATRHRVTADSAELALQEFLLESKLTQQVIEDGEWYVDVGLDIKSGLDGCLQWRTSSHPHIVGMALGIDGQNAARITNMSSTKYHRDLSSHLTAASGCRIEPGSRGEGEFQATYMQMYTTDKAVTYHPEGHHHAKALTVKEAMGKAQPVPFLAGLYSTYIDASQTISSNARIEVRVPFAHVKSALLDIDETVLRDTLLSFKREDWW